MRPIIKTALEYGPLVVFLAAYLCHDKDMLIATKYLMIFSVLSVLITYIYEKTVPKILLYSTIILLFLGSITLITKNLAFIKMKPTILYLILASTLFGGLFYNKILLKNLLGKEISLSDEAWIIFSKRWGYFFIFLALLNEFIWRNFSEIFWIKFKVFGILILFVIFISANITFISKNKNNSSQ